MVKVLRYTFSIIAFDESENRGILFPVDDSTELEKFVVESREKALKLKSGMKWVTLVYNSMYLTNNYPMKNYLNGRTAEIFKDDNEVRHLYDYCFYFYYASSLEKKS